MTEHDHLYLCLSVVVKCYHIPGSDKNPTADKTSKVDGEGSVNVLIDKLNHLWTPVFPEIDLPCHGGVDIGPKWRYETSAVAKWECIRGVLNHFSHK